MVRENWTEDKKDDYTMTAWQSENGISTHSLVFLPNFWCCGSIQSQTSAPLPYSKKGHVKCCVKVKVLAVLLQHCQFSVKPASPRFSFNKAEHPGMWRVVSPWFDSFYSADFNSNMHVTNTEALHLAMKVRKIKRNPSWSPITCI